MGRNIKGSHGNIVTKVIWICFTKDVQSHILPYPPIINNFILNVCLYGAVKLIMYVIMYRFINHKLEIKITNCDINAVNPHEYTNSLVSSRQSLTENRAIFVSVITFAH